jgi:hypothetical protein
MQSYETLIQVKEELGKINEAGLSYNETEALRFLKQESESLVRVAEEVSKSFSNNDLKGALASLMRFVARVNLFGSLLLQPVVISSLNNVTIRRALENLIESCISFVLESYLELAKRKSELGLKTISLNLVANPPAITMSLGAE